MMLLPAILRLKLYDQLQFLRHRTVYNGTRSGVAIKKELQCHLPKGRADISAAKFS